MTDNKAALDLDGLETVAKAAKAARLALAACQENEHNAMTVMLKQSDMLTAVMLMRDACSESVLLALITELRALRAERGWKPLLDAGGLLRVDEGRAYLFAVEFDGDWEYFSDSISWDADEETVPSWHDGGHGWPIEQVTHFRPLPQPPGVER